MKSKISSCFATRKSGLLLVIITLLSFLPGCTTQISSGTPIESSKVSQIVKGKTTRAEVEALLGKPVGTYVLPDGRRGLSYSYIDSKGHVGGLSLLLGPFAKAESTTRMQTLQIYVTKDGVVDDYDFNDNTSSAVKSGLMNVKTTTH